MRAGEQSEEFHRSRKKNPPFVFSRVKFSYLQRAEDSWRRSPFHACTLFVLSGRENWLKLTIREGKRTARLSVRYGRSFGRDDHFVMKHELEEISTFFYTGRISDNCKYEILSMHINPCNLLKTWLPLTPVCICTSTVGEKLASTSDLSLTSIQRSEICVLRASVPWRQIDTVVSITNHLCIAIFALHTH